MFDMYIYLDLHVAFNKVWGDDLEIKTDWKWQVKTCDVKIEQVIFSIKNNEHFLYLAFKMLEFT